MERLTGRLAEARRALASFEELTRRRERSMVERDAAIMRFAYTFEATWKAVQLYLYEHEGLEVGSPKQSIRASRRIGLLTDEQAESALAPSHWAVMLARPTDICQATLRGLKGEARAAAGLAGFVRTHCCQADIAPSQAARVAA